MRLLEIIADLLFQNRRRERAERFAFLDALIETILHFRAPRIGEDRTITKRPRAKLHAPLKPSDNRSIREVSGRARL